MPSGPSEVQVRPGVEAGPEALTDLWNRSARETAVTFDAVAHLPEERRRWLLSHP